jgi:hypothetical protein
MTNGAPHDRSVEVKSYDRTQLEKSVEPASVKLQYLADLH